MYLIEINLKKFNIFVKIFLMNILFRIIILFFLAIFFAQSQVMSPLGSVNHYKNIQHNFNYLDKAITLPNGDSFVIGDQMNTFTTMDIFITKLNSNLDTLWTYKINTPDNTSIDFFQNASVDSNGNLYIHSLNFVNFNSSVTTSKHYITKISSDGNLIFQKTLDQVAQSHNDTNSYLTPNFAYQFAHVDDSDNFVLVFSGYSPTHKVTFFKFLPNNSTEIIHRTDVYSYNPSIDQYGYFVHYYYLNGFYYYLTGVRKGESAGTHEYRLNKMLNQGFVSLDVTPYVVTNQFFLQLRKSELKANALGNVLYFSFDSKNITNSYFTLAVTNELQYLGRYHDDIRFNKLHASQVLDNGNIRLFGNSFINSSYSSSLLSEVVLNANGAIVSDTLRSDIIANQIVPIDGNRVGLIRDNSVEIVNNLWENIKNYTDVSVKSVQKLIPTDSTFTVYAELHSTMVPNYTGQIDNVKTVVGKLASKGFLSSAYVYSSEGNANCKLNTQNLFLSDNSSIITYNCSYGYNTPYSKSYIKKLDSSYNVIFDIESNKSLTKIITSDNQDNIYYGSYSDQRYLTKRNSNGELLFETPQNNFDELLFYNNKLYTIEYEGEFSTINQINTINGNVIQSFTIDKARPQAIFTNGNNHYRYYLKKVNVPSTPYSTNVKLYIYKNFELINTFTVADNLDIHSAIIVDEQNLNAYFVLHSGTDYKLFKVTYNGEITIQPTINSGIPVFMINNSLYVQNGSIINQYDKSNLSFLNGINSSCNRFFKYNNIIIGTPILTNQLVLFNQDLELLENIQIEDNFNFLSIDSLNRLHFNNSFTSGYTLNNLPRWFVSNTKLYDFNQFLLNNEVFEQEIKNQIYVYPNPSSDYISLKYSENEKISSIYIYDLNGKIVSNVNVDEIQLNKINVSFLANGIYILEIRNKIDTQKIKFIKE